MEKYSVIFFSTALMQSFWPFTFAVGAFFGKGLSQEKASVFGVYTSFGDLSFLDVVNLSMVLWFEKTMAGCNWLNRGRGKVW